MNILMQMLLCRYLGFSVEIQNVVYVDSTTVAFYRGFV